MLSFFTSPLGLLKKASRGLVPSAYRDGGSIPGAATWRPLNYGTAQVPTALRFGTATAAGPS